MDRGYHRGLVIKVSYYSRVGLAAGVVVVMVVSRIFNCALPIARERERDIKREHNKRKKSEKREKVPQVSKYIFLNIEHIRVTRSSLKQNSSVTILQIL